MTEVMIRSSVSESFLYEKSEFAQIQSRGESGMLIGDDVEDESTLSFSDNLDIGDKSSDSTICGSNSDDSIVSNLQSAKNLTDMADDVQDSANSTIRSDTSCEDYDYITAETAVMNTTYDMIQQSDVQDMKKISSDKPYTSYQNMKSNVDKSRVIVQMLSSDTKDSTKSQGVFESNSANENQNTLSFRDDVFKILSKPQSTRDFGSDNKESVDNKDALNALTVYDCIKKKRRRKTLPPPIKGSKKVLQSHRKSNLSSRISSGVGRRLSKIKNVSTCLNAATISGLCVLHYILFGSYAVCGSEIQTERVRRKISHFSGFAFDKSSRKYKIRYSSLSNIPLETLRDAHEAIFGKTSALDQYHMVDNLLMFFSDTKTYNEVLKKMQPDIKVISENEYVILKKKAKSGPAPVVMLEKLSCEDLNRLGNELIVGEEVEEKMEVENENVVKDETIEDSYALPAYILKGPGKKLKEIPAIVRNIKNAKENEINMLHYLLYGRVQNEENGHILERRNILEFSGFLKCQNDFIVEVQDLLRRLKQPEMLKLCNIFGLHAKTNSKDLRIKKIMAYLRAPFNPMQTKSVRRKLQLSPKNSSQSKMAVSAPRVPVHPVEVCDEPENAESNDGGYRLRDFRKICSSIECAAPCDLIALNDVLFAKPSDDTEIHDKILNFTRFGFSEDSFHYYYRKTLMFHMGPCKVIRIAELLDIENRQNIKSYEDLAVCILKFLMKKRVPDSPVAKPFVSPSSSFSSKSFMLTSHTDKPGSPENNNPLEVSQQQTNQVISCCQESVFISSVSKLSVTTDLCSPSESLHLTADSEKRNDSVSSSASNVEDDSVPLLDFIHHPTDQELKQVIESIVRTGLFLSEITLGDVVKQVYQHYPDFNLTYRENFIKSETRQILNEMRQNAFHHIDYGFYM